MLHDVCMYCIIVKYGYIHSLVTMIRLQLSYCMSFLFDKCLCFLYRFLFLSFLFLFPFCLWLCLFWKCDFLPPRRYLFAFFWRYPVSFIITFLLWHRSPLNPWVQEQTAILIPSLISHCPSFLQYPSLQGWLLQATKPSAVSTKGSTPSTSPILFLLILRSLTHPCRPL